MTSKTFKSAYPGRSNQSLGIVRADNRVRVSVDHGSDGARGIIIAPSDAPALALAILEAAGWPNEYLATTEILRRLRALDEHAKAVEAEARERAELEAEALELRNAFFAVERKSWDEIASGNSKNDWLRAARRARELAKEATK